MAAKKFPLQLVVEAIDKASGPLKGIAQRIGLLGEPSKKFKAAFGEVAETTAPLFKAAGALKGALANVGTQAAVVGARFATLAAGAAAAFAWVIRGAVESGDKLAEMAQRVGLGVDVYASLQHAASQADVDQESFNSALDQFNKRLGEARAGGGAMLEFLKKVSPALAAQVKGAKSTEAAFALITDAFAKISDPAKQAALSAAVFGKSSLQMGQFLHQGSDAIQRQQREYMRLHGSSEQFAAGASDLDNGLKSLNLAFEGVRDAMATAFFPALTNLSKLVTDFVVKNRDGIQKWAERAAAAIQGWVDGGGFQRLTDFLGKVADGIGWVVTTLGPMGTAMAGAAVIAAPLIGALVSAAGAALSFGVELLALAPALAGLPVLPFVAALGGVALAGVTIAKNWGDLKFIFTDTWNSLTWAARDAWDKVEPIASKLSALFNPRAGFGDSDVPALQPVKSTPSALVRPVTAAAALLQSKSEARVSVDFSNLPAGARVSTDPTSSTPLDVNAGYSMVSQ